jgi:pimeloyl-ACP methyl ester carboxylesterase
VGWPGLAWLRQTRPIFALAEIMTKIVSTFVAKWPSARLSRVWRPDGAPIFYFHGSPSSSLEWDLFGGETLAKRLYIRVIVPDRPGLGHSEFQPERRIGDWPADVVALANQLTLDRFAVLGYSGGGPYAAACALKIPERLTRVGIVSGTARLRNLACLTASIRTASGSCDSPEPSLGFPD